MFSGRRGDFVFIFLCGNGSRSGGRGLPVLIKRSPYTVSSPPVLFKLTYVIIPLVKEGMEFEQLKSKTCTTYHTIVD